MKRIFLYFCICFLTLSLKSQIVQEGNTFKVEQKIDKQTPYFYTDKRGNKYPIYISGNGSCYIIKTSKKTGKKYKQYLPKDLQEKIRTLMGFKK